jgi:hypothetical protein
MKTLTDREKSDIGKMEDNVLYYSSLPEHRKTEAVSLAAVSIYCYHLSVVPEEVISKEFEGREICRAALAAKDTDVGILQYIPFPDVLKEGIEKFAANTKPFILYSFLDLHDAKMAQEAVKADANCIFLIPEKTLTKDLCKMALDSPNAGEEVNQYVKERYPELNQKPETERQKTGVKIKF